MVDVAMAEPASARDAPEEQNPEMLKQQAQLLEFNEYIHKCRDLYKSDPTMVSPPKFEELVASFDLSMTELALIDFDVCLRPERKSSSGTRTTC